jgi:hypothetical protein
MSLVLRKLLVGWNDTFEIQLTEGVTSLLIRMFISSNRFWASLNSASSVVKNASGPFT